MSAVQKQILYPDSLPVMEQFYTLQGEGQYSGHAAYFIRLAGCDVGCVWCDVKESWVVADSQWKKIEEIVGGATDFPSRIAVITGGEPAMYDLTQITKLLKNNGFRVHLETSGAYQLKGSFDWITVSPKKFKEPLKEVITQANELKVVVFHPSDIEWAEKHAQSAHKDCLLLLQPEWSRRERHNNLLIDYIKSHPQWSLSLQTHKYIDIP